MKLYTISSSGASVDIEDFLPRVRESKEEKNIDWKTTASFAIFHAGAEMNYLVLAWWGNGNELFTPVSVEKEEGWVEDSNRYSFCLWDLEVFWHERNSFIKHMYSGHTDIEAYRADLKTEPDESGQPRSLRSLRATS